MSHGARTSRKVSCTCLSCEGCQAVAAPLVFRPYHSRDRDGVVRLLHFLTALYPGGADWLSRRLYDVEAGQASCDVVSAGKSPVALIIQTGKGTGRLKLCTFYVAPGWRSIGLGTVLLSHAQTAWLRSGILEVRVTADSERAVVLQPLLHAAGFRRWARVPDRYR